MADNLYLCVTIITYIIHTADTTFTEDPIRRSSCITSGGQCESLFPCLFSMGIAAKSCGGFLSVCCVKPATVNRWLNDNRIQDEVNAGFKKTNKERVHNDPKCGIRPTANRRVIDGSDAGFGTFPWQALIRIGKAKCGGVLVNRQHVVTAGHCIKNKRIESLNVTLGEYNIGESLADGEIFPSQTYKVQAMVVHPKFQFSPAADRFDVAVLKLSSPVNYISHIAPICLPQVGRDPEPGTVAYAAGWGAIIPDDQLGPLAFLIPKEQKRPKVLQVVDVPLIENDQCEVWHKRRGITVRLYPEMLCAGYKSGGKDSCKGDSGGPLMVRQRDGRFVLVGLVSAGFSCGKPGQPGIYHRISATADWISFQANGGLDRLRA